MSRTSMLGSLLALVLLGGVAHATPSYDPGAKANLSANDIDSFVYHWFAGFDHQEDDAYFLMFLPAKVDMEMPDFPIRSVEDFKRWYDGVRKTVQWNAHVIDKVAVREIGPQRWLATVTLDWSARTYDGKKLDQRVMQELTISSENHRVQLVKHRAHFVPK